MDLKHFEEKLLVKQQECRDTLQKLQADASETDVAEVRDSGDDAVADEELSETLEEGTVVSNILQLAESALARIKDGSYGTCLACEEEIAQARLEAIPWAQYCIKDQERLDRENNVPTGTTL